VRDSETAIDKYLADAARRALVWIADMNTERAAYLLWFARRVLSPVLVLGGDNGRRRLAGFEYKMWNLAGLSPSNWTTRRCRLQLRIRVAAGIIESTYYLYHSTHDAKYCDGQTISMRCTNIAEPMRRTRRCRCAHQETEDSMEAFSRGDAEVSLPAVCAGIDLPFDSVIFNTEAHPMQRSAG